MARERPRTIEERFAELEELLVGLRRDLAAAAPPRAHATVEIAVAAERWIRGVGWDETFTAEMVEDELARLERRRRAALAVEERQRLLALWRALRAERYPAAA